MNWYKKIKYKLANYGPHGVNRKWSNEDLEKMRKLYEKGYTSVQISPFFLCLK